MRIWYHLFLSYMVSECPPGEVFSDCHSCPRTCAELIDPLLCIAVCERSSHGSACI